MEKAKTVLAVGGIVFYVACLGLAIYGGIKASQAENQKNAIVERYEANELELQEYQEKMDVLVADQTDYLILTACTALGAISVGVSMKSLADTY